MAKKAVKGKLGANTGYRIFVSHATADKWIARVVCEKLEAIGAKTFRDDRDIAGGDDIPEEIRKNIILASELVVLITPESVDRSWVLFEVGAMWGRRQNARIVAILCHVEHDTIPELIKSKKAISINSFDEYLAELAGRLARRRI